jgi:hypothetical protein
MRRGAWDNVVREVDMQKNMVKTATFMSVKTLEITCQMCLFAR